MVAQSLAVLSLYREVHESAEVDLMKPWPFRFDVNQLSESRQCALMD
jgi:hypothetical protein